MDNKAERDAIIADCGGDLKKAAQIINRRQEDHWIQVARLRKPWPEEEPVLQQQILDGIADIRGAITNTHKPKEIIIYRDRPSPTPQEQTKGFER
jgi:hypothetical protein